MTLFCATAEDVAVWFQVFVHFGYWSRALSPVHECGTTCPLFLFTETFPPFSPHPQKNFPFSSPLILFVSRLCVFSPLFLLRELLYPFLVRVGIECVSE